MKKRNQSKEVKPKGCGCPQASPVRWTEAQGVQSNLVSGLRIVPEWRKRQSASRDAIAKYDAVGLSFDPVGGDLIWWYDQGSQTREPLDGRVVWFVPAGINHSCEWRQDADCVVLLLSPQFVRQINGKPLDVVRIHEVANLEREDLFIWQLVSELRRVFRSDEEPDPLYLSSITVLLAVHLLRAHGGRKAEARARTGGLSPKALHAVTQYIHENLSSKLSLSMLAKRAHLGPRQFGMLFKASTGFSPSQYILHARVQKAHELLRTERCRVADAAYEVGFYDQSHLDRHFRRVFGFPPSALLRRAHEAASVARPA